ncbi:hypothetical protein BC829DRAFT_493077 [Chytridium lagenaria]|nr:hypothetical protein BC829DRAFT_493077 [Chytridium lagenaria]
MQMEIWAQQRIVALLQLSNEDAKQMVEYVMTLSKEEASSYLIVCHNRIYGDGGESFDFVSQFMEKRFPSDAERNNASPNRKAQAKAQPAKAQPTKAPASPKQWKDEKNVKKKVPKPAVKEARIDGSDVKEEAEDLIDKEMRKALKRERQAAKKSCGVCYGRIYRWSGETWFTDELLDVWESDLQPRRPGACPSCGTLVESALQQINLVQTNKRSSRVKEAMDELSKSKSKDSYTGSRAAKAIGTPGKVSEASYPVLLSDKDMEALTKAQEQKERLLEYQRNSAVRSKVHDTASDFDYSNDSSNIWLTPEERALALKKAQEQRKKEEDQRRRRVITLDLGTRRVISVDAKEFEPAPVTKAVIPG